MGCVHWDHSEISSADDSQDMADNQVLSTLRIAQHEWKKVLDGTSGPTRRPMLPMNDAITNTFWGDEFQAKAGNLFRLYVQNVNGLSLDRRGGQFDNLCQVQKEAQADVFLGQEHNVDSTQFQVKSILHATCKQHWERYRLNIATTPISFKLMYKPGGRSCLPWATRLDGLSRRLKINGVAGSAKPFWAQRAGPSLSFPHTKWLRT